MIEKNTLEKTSKRNRNYRPLAAFFVTLFAFALIFLINMITPFGDRSILTSDLSAQYGPYLIGYKNAIKSGQSLFYSQGLGLGQNTMGMFAYYLSSPLNFIVFLFPDSRLQEAITVLIMIKLSFAGAFMTWLLDRKFKNEDKMSIMFGLMYPTCAFVLIFMFNIMWLDGFAILPLLILLTESFVDNKKKWPVLTLLLLLLFVSGYYMAYMVGAFSFLYLLVFLGQRGGFAAGKGKETGKTVGQFILSAVVAGMMSACILLPAGLNTLGNGDYSKRDSLTLDPNFPLIKMADQFVNSRVEDLSNNAPILFCGVTVLFLCILFFLNPKIQKNLKILIGLVFGFGVFSFHLPILNLAWHLFDNPNWFNYRYAYLFSFVMILVAFYSYQHMKDAERKHFFTAFGVIAGIAAVSQSFGQMSKENNAFFATLLFAFLVCVLLYGMTLEKWADVITNLKRFGTAFLVIVIVVEIVVFNPRCYMPCVFGEAMDAPLFVAEVEDMQELASREDPHGWYRSEIHKPWDYMFRGNTTVYYINKPGISIFASMANKRTNHFLKQLGYEVNYNYFAVDHTNVILPADTILGVRYVISTDHNVTGLEYKTNVNQYYLYENPYALPIAFLAKEDAYAFDGYALEKDEKSKDYFAFQENWIASLSGEDASDLYDTWTQEWELLNGQVTDIRKFEVIAAGDVVVNSLNAEKKDITNKNLTCYLRNNDKSPMVLRTKVTIDRRSPLLLNIPFMYMGCVVGVCVDGNSVFMQDSSSFYSQIMDLGTYNVGQTITVEIRTTQDVYGSFEPIFAYCNTESVAKQAEILRQGVSNVDVKNGHVTLQTSSNTANMLFTSIPYEKGWTAKVDGQEVDIAVYQDAFISLPLTAGNHVVELSFTPPGWKAGLLGSAVGILAFAAGTMLCYRKKKEHEPVVNEPKTNE